jgi:hypothetical protein
VNVPLSTLDEVQAFLDERTDVLISGPCSDAMIDAAQAALGAAFPPTFRTYLARWGAINVTGLSLEYLGVLAYLGILAPEADDPYRLPYPHVVSHALKAWSRGLPRRYLIVRDESGHRYVCLDSQRRRSDGEWLVTRWDPIDRVVEDEPGLDFAELMLDELRERQEFL